MNRCIRCKRPLKLVTDNGMGPVCAKLAGAGPLPKHERDLFGYDTAKAAAAAQARLSVCIEIAYLHQSILMRSAFAQARHRLLTRAK